MRRLVIPLALCAAVVFAALSVPSPHSAAPMRAKHVPPARSLALHR